MCTYTPRRYRSLAHNTASDVVDRRTKSIRVKRRTIEMETNQDENLLNWITFSLLVAAKIIIGIAYSLYALVGLVINTLYPVEKSLKDKVILVTGAGRGLGREISFQLAKEGAQLVCVDINAEGVRETAETINSDSGDKSAAEFHVTNVADPVQVNELAKTVTAKWGKVDVLINNAGIVASSPLLDSTDDQISRMVDVNLMSHFWMVRAFLPNMKKRNDGHIVATSSVAAYTCAANIVPYAATKYGVTGMMSSLREELRSIANNNIKTTTVHPFFLDSTPTKVEHWKVKSALPCISIPNVASATIRGIKRDSANVTVPEVLRFLMGTLCLLPQKSADYWRDAFSSQINKV